MTNDCHDLEPTSHVTTQWLELPEWRRLKGLDWPNSPEPYNTLSRKIQQWVIARAAEVAAVADAAGIPPTLPVAGPLLRELEALDVGENPVHSSASDAQIRVRLDAALDGDWLGASGRQLAATVAVQHSEDLQWRLEGPEGTAAHPQRLAERVLTESLMSALEESESLAAVGRSEARDVANRLSWFLHNDNYLAVWGLPVGGLAPDGVDDDEDWESPFREHHVRIHELGSYRQTYLAPRPRQTDRFLRTWAPGFSFNHSKWDVETHELVSETVVSKGDSFPDDAGFEAILAAFALMGYTLWGDGTAGAKAVPEWAHPDPAMRGLPMPRRSRERAKPLTAEMFAGILDLAGRLPRSYQHGAMDVPSNALRRFVQGVGQSDAGAAIADFVTAMEAVLTPGPDALTFRFCLNGANLLEQSPRLRRARFNELKALYGARSAQVHGTGPNRKKAYSQLQGIEGEKLRAAARQYAAQVLLAAFDSTRWTNSWPNEDDLLMLSFS